MSRVNAIVLCFSVCKKGREVHHAGIILKNITSHKIALLDKERGRLDAIVIKPLCVGSLLHYRIEKERGTLVYLVDTSLTDLPFALAREDLLFWHHVLELCFYFVPLGSYTSELFELCTFLYTVDMNEYWSMQAKKLYLFKLLNVIGVYPQLPHISPEKLHHFMALPLSKIMDEVLDGYHEKKLDEWLRVCVSDHPAITKFNTIHYLLATGCHD